jgi:hypothetical protein
LNRLKIPNRCFGQLSIGQPTKHDAMGVSLFSVLERLLNGIAKFLDNLVVKRILQWEHAARDRAGAE